jgi:hypothetical protein
MMILSEQCLVNLIGLLNDYEGVNLQQIALETVSNVDLFKFK